MNKNHEGSKSEVFNCQIVKWNIREIMQVIILRDFFLKDFLLFF